MTMKPSKYNAALKGVVTGVLILVALLVYQLYQQNESVDEGSISLQAPFFIPVQSHFLAAVDPSQNPVIAVELWRHALSDFRSASDDLIAIRQAAPLLRDIWTNWPDTDIAVQAQLFYLGTLESYQHDDAWLEHALAFMEQAIQSPRLYFSSEHQAAAQWVAVHLIQALVGARDHATAWRMCIRLRWLAPRIELIAPVCESVIEDTRSVALASSDTLSLLSPFVSISEIPTEKQRLSLLKAVQAYLAAPYNAEVLALVIIELYKGGFEELSSALLLELLQLDPVKQPKIEMIIDKLKAADKRV